MPPTQNREKPNFFYIVKLREIGLHDNWISAIILGYSAIQLLTPFFMNRTAFCKAAALPVELLIVALVCLLLALGGGHLSLLPMLILPLLLSLPSFLVSMMSNELVDELHLEKQRASFLSIVNQGANLFEIAFLFSASAIPEQGVSVIFYVLAGLFFFVALIIRL